MKVAVITPLLPETTGVAEFSERLYRNKKEFDVFWTRSDHAFDVNDFFARAVQQKYEAIIFTLANSPHNYPTVELLSRFSGFPSVHRKLFLHIHDPVLMNVARHVCEKNQKNVLDFYEQEQGLKKGTIGDIYNAFEKYGYTGLSSLLSTLNINTIIVHSDAALELTKRDLGARANKIPHFVKLFHPCFDEMANVPWNEREFDVGIFGVADDGGKMTSRAVESILKAHEKGTIKKAVMCGYNAKSYAAEKKIDKLPFFTFIENPSHGEMFKVMSKTKVAIQPRLLNTGESSGVVPMLIAANVRSIVSRVGAFVEFPDSLVTKINNSEFVPKCVEALPRLLKEPISSSDCEAYWRKHSADNFIKGLTSHIKSLAKV